VQSYTSLADFRTKVHAAATSLAWNVKEIEVWAPFKRKNTWNLDYVSYYDSNVDMDPALWAPLYPATGQDCVHCNWESCVDDSCGIIQKLHICSFPLGPPIAQLRGLCSDTIFGNNLI